MGLEYFSKSDWADSKWDPRTGMVTIPNGRSGMVDVATGSPHSCEVSDFLCTVMEHSLTFMLNSGFETASVEPNALPMDEK